MSPEHVKITVTHILYADLHGIDSHGCSMMHHYHRSYADGRLSMTPKIEVIRETKATALIDGGGGLGHVPADKAMRLAIAKCRSSGIGAVAVRNSGHFGAAGAYTSMAAQEGFIGMATTSTHAPALVPTFGAEALLGTNPIAFAAPAVRNQIFSLDMATSTVPIGRLTDEWRKGNAIPVGWAMNRKCRPIRNGRAATKHRMVTPLGMDQKTGGHKGYGLAAMVEILSAILPGVTRSRKRGGGDGRAGHFFLALDPRQFSDEGEFEEDLDDMVDMLHACRRADPNRPVLVAGDPEHAKAEERERSGIPLSKSVFEDIRSVARASGVAFLLEGEA
jgi:LDH2 family malate/lactate/ureidoglycolate dehydrogenase